MPKNFRTIIYFRTQFNLVFINLQNCKMLKLLSGFRSLLTNEVKICSQQAGALFHTTSMLEGQGNSRPRGPTRFLRNNQTIFEPQLPDEKPRPAVSRTAIMQLIEIMWFINFSMSATKKQTSNTARKRCGLCLISARLNKANQNHVNSYLYRYLSSFIRGMTIDEAIKQLSFILKRGAGDIKQCLLEAQEMAVKDHNVEFKSNLWVGEYLTSLIWSNITIFSLNSGIVFIEG